MSNLQQVQLIIPVCSWVSGCLKLLKSDQLACSPATKFCSNKLQGCQLSWLARFYQRETTVGPEANVQAPGWQTGTITLKMKRKKTQLYQAQCLFIMSLVIYSIKSI